MCMDQEEEHIRVSPEKQIIVAVKKQDIYNDAISSYVLLLIYCAEKEIRKKRSSKETFFFPDTPPEISFSFECVYTRAACFFICHEICFILMDARRE